MRPPAHRFEQTLLPGEDPRILPLNHSGREPRNRTSSTTTDVCVPTPGQESGMRPAPSPSFWLARGLDPSLRRAPGRTLRASLATPSYDAPGSMVRHPSLRKPTALRTRGLPVASMTAAPGQASLASFGERRPRHRRHSAKSPQGMSPRQSAAMLLAESEHRWRVRGGTRRMRDDRGSPHPATGVRQMALGLASCLRWCARLGR